MPARPADAPAVTVVLPVRNGQETLREAVESILRQSHVDLECLVIDDGSTDGTPEIARRLQAEDPRVRTIRQPGRGLVVTLNRGLAEARGRYVARMDADDIAFPDRLERQVRHLDRHPSVAVVGGAMQLLGPAGPEERFLRFPCAEEDVRRALGTANCIAHPTVVMRREVVHTAGGYRAAFVHCEDYDLWLRLAERHGLANLPDPVVYYRLHAGQVTTAHLGQEVLSALAAREAARRRGRGDAEPDLTGGPVTRERLVTLGLGREDIDNALVGGYIHRANVMLSLGLTVEAEAVTAEMRRLDLVPGVRTRARAELSWLRAKAALRAGRWLAGAGWLARACWQRPAFVANLVAAAPPGRWAR